MQMKKWLLAGAAVIAVTLANTSVAYAQQVTGGLRGVVRGADGSPIAGATIQVVSEGTGAVLNVTTNDAGTFNVSSLAVGATYSVKVVAPGYQNRTFKHINLSVGQTTTLDADLSTPSAAAAETVVVTGTRAKQLASVISETRGVASTISAADIANTPTVSHDFKDIIQRVPYAFVDPVGGGSSPPVPTMSIGGANPRCTNLMVDGLQQKDNFGLNQAGYPTTRAPVSTIWASQTQIALTPYDVQYNDACGGFINIVTKSGSNDFHGSAYGYFTNDSLNGVDEGKYDSVSGGVTKANPTKPTFDEKNYGLTFSGPILADKLFFFLGYDEIVRTSSPGASAVGPAGSGYSSEAKYITQSQVNQVVDIAKSVYGFNPGSFQDDFTEYNQRVIGKLTWQINENHSIDLKYQRSAGATLSINNGSSSDTAPRVTLPSNWYTNAQKMEVYTLSHTGHWTSNFTTELSLGHESVKNFQTPLYGTDFPEVYVRTPGQNGLYDAANAASPDDGYIRLGPDFSRHYNYLWYKRDFVKALATYTLGDHTFEGGLEWHRIGIDDKFVQGAQSVVRFDTIDDFQNRVISSQIITASNGVNASSSAIGGNPAYIASGYVNGKFDNSGADGIFKYNIFSVYAQDTWYPIQNLSLVFGLRYDRYMANDVTNSTTNQNAIVVNPYFKQRYGFGNTLTVNGLDAILPRFSFSYNFDPDIGFVSGSVVTVRGGVGMYSSGVQTVWLTNNYDTTGINSVNAAGIPGATGAWANVPKLLPTNHQDWINDLVGSSGPLQNATVAKSSTVDFQLPNFKLPKSLRENLGFDFNFGEGVLGKAWQFSFDYSNTSNYDSPYWTNYRLVDSGVKAPDGRKTYLWRYGSKASGGTGTLDPVTNGNLTGSDIGLGSMDGGNSTLFITQIANQWNDTGYGDFNVSLGYAHSQVSDVTAATSSTASSSYNYTARVNFNDPEVGTSDYERVHRFTLNFTATEKFIGDYKTTFNIFAQRMSGQHYSLTFNNTPFAPSGALTQRSLVYIPKADSSGAVTATSDPIVTFSGNFLTKTDPNYPGLTGLALFNQVMKDLNLQKYAGQILPRNSQSGPWNSLVNLSLEQELPGVGDVFDFDNGGRLVGTMSIYNFLNILNPKWGPLSEPNFYQAYQFVTASIVNGKYNYTDFQTTSNIRSNISTTRSASTYQIQFGVRYEF